MVRGPGKQRVVSSENPLSMLERAAAQARGLPSAGPPREALERRSRRRALATCAALALAVHLGFLAEVIGLSIGAAPDASATPVTVRTIAPRPGPSAESEPVRAPTAVGESAVDAPIAPPPTPVQVARAPRESAPVAPRLAA